MKTPEDPCHPAAGRFARKAWAWLLLVASLALGSTVSVWANGGGVATDITLGNAGVDAAPTAGSFAAGTFDGGSAANSLISIGTDTNDTNNTLLKLLADPAITAFNISTASAGSGIGNFTVSGPIFYNNSHSLTLSASAAFSTSSAITNTGSGTLSLSAGTNLALGASLSAASGTITLQHAGSLAQSAGIVTASKLTLQGAGSVASSGTPLVTTVDTLELAKPGGDTFVRNSTGLALQGTTAADLSVEAAGAISQTAALAVGGNLSLNAGATHDIDLTNLGNNFAVVEIASGKDVSLTDTNGFQLGTLTLAGTLRLASTTITVTGAVNAASIVVNAGTLRLNSSDRLAGTAALNLAASGAKFDLNGFAQTLASLTGVDGTTVALGSTGALKTAGNDNAVFHGAITGANTASFTKSGTGTLTLHGTGSNVPTIVVDNGYLRIGVAGALASATDIEVKSAGTLLVDADQTIRGFTGNGSVQIDTNQALTVNQPSYSATPGDVMVSTFTGTITATGSGLLVKDGPGTLIFTGWLEQVPEQPTGHVSLLSINGERTRSAQTYAPSLLLDVRAGTFQLGDGENNGTVGGDISVSDKLIFQSGSSTTFGHKFDGSGTIVKAGTSGSTLTLTGNNACFDGTFSIQRGTLALGSANAISSGASVIVGSSEDSATFAIGTNAADNVAIRSLSGGGFTTLSSGKLLTVSGVENTSYTGLISGAGSLAKSGSGTLTLAGPNTYAGGTSVEGGTLAVSGATAAILHSNADIGVDSHSWGEGADPQARLEIFHGGTVVSRSSTLGSVYAGYASVSGTGSTWTNSTSLIVGDTGKGSLTVAEGGTISIDSGNGDVVLGASHGGSGLLVIGSDDETPSAGGIVNAAKITTGSGTGTVRLSTNSSYEVPYYLTKDGTYTGTAVSVTGANRLESTAGFTVLKGANTYTGSTKIKNSTLLADTAGALPAATHLGLESWGFLKLNASQTVAGFLESICEATSAGIVLGHDTTLTIAPASSDDGPGKFIGSISGDGALEYVGPTSAGLSLTLSGHNTYQGGTTVSHGLLVVDGDAITGLGTGSITLNAAGILGLDYGAKITNHIALNGAANTGNRAFVAGFGTLAPSDQILTIASHAGLSPGAKLDPNLSFDHGGSVPPVGTLSIGVTESPTSVTFASGGRYDWGIQSTTDGLLSDQLAITGTLTFTSTLSTPFTFKLTTFDSHAAPATFDKPGFDATQPTQWKIVSTTGGITGFSTSVVSIDASGFLNFPTNAAFSLSTGDNNKSLFLNFDPAAVPEPSTWALLLTGLAVTGLVALRRRR